MSLELANDVWQILKQYVQLSDLSEAADLLVETLIEHDYFAEDIVDVFSEDADVKKVAAHYLKDLDDQDTDDNDDLWDDNELEF